MDYPALVAFLTVVEEGSFSGAAEKLLRTQPAVSLAVRRLEEDLGEQLIERSSRELLLTEAGRVVWEHGRRFEGLHRELLAALEERRRLQTGRLVIGANESSTLYLLQSLRRFRSRYPGIAIRVQRCRSSEIPDRLRGGELELGVISYAPAGREIVSQVIYRDHLAFIVSPQHPFASRPELSVADLGDETFIAHNVVSPYRRVVLRKFQQLGVPLRMDVEVPTLEAIRKLVQQNEGVAFLPRMCVEQEIAQGTLREVRLRDLKVDRKIRLVYPRKRQLRRASMAFLELVRPGK